MLKIIALIIICVSLYNDYKRDKRQHLKAKIYHSVFLLLITLMYVDSFRFFLWMLWHFDLAMTTWSKPVGVIGGEFHLFINIVNVLIGMALTCFSYQASTRKEYGRIWIIKLFPVVALTETFTFYRGWTSDGFDSETNHTLILFIGALLFGGLCFTIIKVYASNYMLLFFKRTDLKLKVELMEIN